ncbi:MAG: hypothetical protein ACD_75C00645G0003 [uncultured bacterium]|nr:MAG: hypothetical protein ACD_75C00645G0003 [uncultured bacterium]
MRRSQAAIIGRRVRPLRKSVGSSRGRYVTTAIPTMVQRITV